MLQPEHGRLSSRFLAVMRTGVNLPCLRSLLFSAASEELIRNTHDWLCVLIHRGNNVILKKKGPCVL